MPNLADYFAKNSYTAQYHIGDRIRGIWCGAPFAGSVAIDTLLDEDAGPYIIVNLDLPLKLDGVWYNMLKVQHSDLIDIGGSYGINRKTNSKKSSLDSN